ncbi:uL15 family ribosomal protein [Candidatus Woesearchaeota archaeon]|nr:uL15 family ribosomal protein [Candidatus Woesearchaeota archaeon]
MPFNRRKKCVRCRASRTHGWGTKKHRGAGNRGGKGMAGTGKRADQIKPLILKLYGPEYFGHHGFKRPQKVTIKIKAINVGNLEQLNFDKKENGKIVADLKDFGYNKLLAKGMVTKAYKVIVDFATPSAVEKIAAKGGEVELKFKKEE